MTYETLILERRGPVGWLRFNRPDALNSHSLTMLAELPEAWHELNDDDDVVVIVVTGNGRAFCTGADVKEIAASGGGMKERLEKGPPRRGDIGPRGNQVWKPVIAAVNGVCAGGGLRFVADADLVLAAERATFVDTHVSVGQVAALEPIALLGRIPFAAVMELALIGRHARLSAERAETLGLVNRVVREPEELDDAAQQLAETIALNSPSALMATKRAVWQALELGRADALAEGMKIVEGFWGHPDNAEGPRAFADKRAPDWAPPVRTFDR